MAGDVLALRFDIASPLVAIEIDAMITAVGSSTDEFVAGLVNKDSVTIAVDEVRLLPDHRKAVNGPARAAKHYGDLLGSNEFDTERLGAVVGSRHYGDTFIEKWAAFAGEGTERADDTPDGKGDNLAYTGFGNETYEHMTANQTLQAAMRFGRDGRGTVVYVHTDTLPDWVVES